MVVLLLQQWSAHEKNVEQLDDGFFKHSKQYKLQVLLFINNKSLGYIEVSGICMVGRQSLHRYVAMHDVNLD